MFFQIALGTVLVLFSILIAASGFWLMEIALARIGPWLVRSPHRPKQILVLSVAAVWVMVQMTIAVWAWALTMMALGVFETLEPSVYFALVAFTTLGFGDVLLPTEWRLLGGMAAANGLLNIGLVTAVLVEGLRQVRLQQLSAVHEDT